MIIYFPVLVNFTALFFRIFLAIEAYDFLPDFTLTLIFLVIFPSTLSLAVTFGIFTDSFCVTRMLDFPESLITGFFLSFFLAASTVAMLLNLPGTTVNPVDTATASANANAHLRIPLL